MQSKATCGLGVPNTLCREENDLPLDWRHDLIDTTGLLEYKRSTRVKSKEELYQGEDMICQNPEDIDPNRWLDKGELMELLEIPLEEWR